MPEDQGQQPEIPANAVPTADGTSFEAPASDNSPTTTPPVQPQPRPSKVAGVEEYERELSEALASVETPEPGTPAEAETTVDPDEPTAPAEEPPKKEFRPRLNGIKDPQTQEAILLVSSLAAEGKPISLAEAERRIGLKYWAEPPEETPIRQPEDVASELAALKEERKQAIRDLDPDRQIDVEDKMEALREEQATIATQTQLAESTAQQAFDRQVEQSHVQAAGIYPVMTDENHAIHAKATEIWANMEKTRNPLIHDESAPLQVYQMAANALGIAPSDPGTPLSFSRAQPSSTPATPKPQAVPVSAVRRPTPGVSLPSGAASTTHTGPPADPAGKISSVHEYDQLMEQLN